MFAIIICNDVLLHFILISSPMFHLKQRLKAEAEEIKEKGNQLFKSGEFRESAITYTLALRTCPISFPNDRSKLYSNRAAAKMKLVSWIISCALAGALLWICSITITSCFVFKGLSKSAIEDCNQALDLNPGFVRALWRRSQLYETTDKLDEALEDCKKILEIEPNHREAISAVKVSALFSRSLFLNYNTYSVVKNLYFYRGSQIS